MKIAIGALALALTGIPAARAQQYTISAFAGGAPPTTPIAGNLAPIGSPARGAFDRSGNFYFAAANFVFRLDAASTLTLVAGNGQFGYSGDDGPAVDASFSGPTDVAVDAGGNVYIADGGNQRIRMVSPAGIITTFAGNGTAGFSGDGGPASGAQVSYPYGLTADAAGNVYISDGSNRVRKVSTKGIITTFAGNGTAGFAGDGGPAIDAELNTPAGLRVDAAGNLYIADFWNNRIRRVSPAGVITTVAGNGSQAYSGDGGLATAASLNQPGGLDLDSSGNLYIADSFNSRIRVVSTAGIIDTVTGNGTAGFSGDGGAASSAEINYPEGVAVDPSGNVYISDSGNDRVRKITAAGIIGTAAGDGYTYSIDGGPASSALLYQPTGLALDAAGNVYIADANFHRIWKVSTAGIITTAAGTGFVGYSGDGGPAASAQLNTPTGVALDAAGNMYIADTGNGRIRKVSAADGTIATIAHTSSAGIGSGPVAGLPQGIAVDGGGNVYFADELVSIPIILPGPFLRARRTVGPGYAGYTTVSKIAPAGSFRCACDQRR